MIQRVEFLLNHLQNEKEVEYMHALFKQGQINKVPLEMISDEEARKIDSNVRGYGREFIWSPTTSTVDTKSVIQFMARET